MKKLGALLAVLAASSVIAQPLTVGSMPANTPITATLTDTAPVTWVDLSNPATASGTVNRASVQWAATCSGAFKIVFLRTSNTSVSSFSVVATRGPFDATLGRNDVALVPPVPVVLNDLIAVVQLKPAATCGSILFQPNTNGAGYRLITNSDLSTSPAGSLNNYYPDAALGLITYASDPLLVRVVPAAGAVQGVGGAFFRTSMQLLNASFTKITGQLRFHPAGRQGSDTDPSLGFVINSQQVLSYPDVVTTMGASGLGSIDVLTNGGTPIVTTRIFTDGGTSGTSGFTQEAFPPRSALGLSQRGQIVIAPDLTNFRMNVGVRTLDAATTLQINTYAADGTSHGTRTVTYPPNFFEQVPINTFAGTTVEAGGSIVVTNPNYPGAAFVYASTTDNRTQDSSIRFATGN